MTRLERALVRRRTMLFIVAALLFLGSAVTVAFILIGRQTDRANQLATEADLRGTAVSTLAGDVRALRSQVQAKGGTPVAPDPAKAVPNLPSRTEVPVPIPGPPGPKGDQGARGASGASAPPIPGPSGPAGSPGANSTIPGPAGSPGGAGVQGVPGVPGANGKDGAPGKDGTDGTNGTDGKDGAPGTPGQPPAGWTYTDPAGQSYTCSPASGFDPSAPRYACTADAAPTPSPSPSPSPSTTPPALLSTRRRT